MALAKQYVKSKPTIAKVTFTLAANAVNGATTVSVVGDFNEWNPETTLLTKQKDGSYKKTIELELGKTYQFRYLIDGQKWENEQEADDFVPSGVSSDQNSVVAL